MNFTTSLINPLQTEKIKGIDMRLNITNAQNENIIYTKPQYIQPPLPLAQLIQNMQTIQYSMQYPTSQGYPTTIQQGYPTSQQGYPTSQGYPTTIQQGYPTSQQGYPTPTAIQQGYPISNFNSQINCNPNVSSKKKQTKNDEEDDENEDENGDEGESEDGDANEYEYDEDESEDEHEHNSKKNSKKSTPTSTSKWQYQGNSKWYSFNTNDNQTIESAFNKNKQSIIIKINNQDYVIDLKQMKQYPKSDPKKIRAIRRQ
eukprot:TRINITY_DN256_c0_g1_i3.p1 TRINITY_DN256_c0_g1~~TRINITY_DN256_c0_g1_i3.p1  ORF type:complete len:258 (+),score=100.37 TRINITY_DN256_c0_g1_i3:92-865(+)